MAQETTEKKSRSSRTPRATQPVWVRIFPISVTKTVVNRKMVDPSVRKNDL